MTTAALELPARPRKPAQWRLFGTLLAGVFLGAMLGLALLVVAATQFLGYRVLTVSSNSMYPALAAGDVIVVKPASAGTVDVGDVVLFTSGGDSILTIHRVVGRNEVVTNVTSRSTGERTTYTDYRLVTQGDANASPDGGEVTAAQLQGQLWFSFANPLAGSGVSPQALLFAFGGVLGVAWAAWELTLRRRSTDLGSER